MRKWALIPLSILALAVPAFVTDPYFLGVLVTTLLSAVLAVSLLLMLNTGLFFCAIAAFMAIGAYFSAIVTMKLGLSFWLAFPLAGCLSAAVAAVIGLPTLRVGGLWFMIITFGLNEVTRLAVNSWSYVGGPGGISGIPPPSPFFIGYKFLYYYLVLALFAFVVLIVYRLWNSRLGLVWRSIKGNEVLAGCVGVNIMKYKILVFTTVCFVAGLTGSFFAHYYRFIAPEEFSLWKSFFPLVYLQVGGVASIAGPIVGTFFLRGVEEFFRITPFFQPLIFGLILIVVMRLFPPGLLGIWDKFWASIKPSSGKKSKGGR